MAELTEEERIVDPECFSRLPHQHEPQIRFNDKIWCVPCLLLFYPEDVVYPDGRPEPEPEPEPTPEEPNPPVEETPAPEQ